MTSAEALDTCMCGHATSDHAPNASRRCWKTACEGSCDGFKSILHNATSVAWDADGNMILPVDRRAKR